MFPIWRRGIHLLKTTSVRTVVYDVKMAAMFLIWRRGIHLLKTTSVRTVVYDVKMAASHSSFSVKPLAIGHLHKLKSVNSVAFPVDETDLASSREEKRSFQLGVYKSGLQKASELIVLTQTVTLPEGKAREESFELYRGSDSENVFQSVQSSLQPLLESCEISFDVDLLTSIISPSPRPISHLPSILLKLERLHSGKDGVSPDASFAGKSLLHFACEANDEESFTALIKKGANISDASTVIHSAAKHSLSCLKHLLGHANKVLSKAMYAEFLHAGDKETHTPLHKAVHHNNGDAMEALISAGAKLSVSAASSNKENPLHIAAKADYHECIEKAFERYGFLKPTREDEKERESDQIQALNGLNEDGDTPLLVAIGRENLRSVLNLILEGADVNAVNPNTLDTPLHVAARYGFLTLVQLLLVFGAKPQTKNKLGKTPIEEAQEKNAEESLKAIRTIVSAQNEDVIPLEPLDPLPEGSAVVLSFDGGGMRGLVLAQLLLFLQQRIAELSPSSSHISSLFDWVGGTSTGAIMALAFIHSKASPENCMKLYFKFKSKALKPHRVYPTSSMEASLKEAFGHDDTMADIHGTKVVIPTTLADRLPPVLHLMCNYGGPRNEQTPPSQLPLWEAVRATSAAPTYFEQFQEKFVDGGLMANNPTVDLMTEIYSHTKEKDGKCAKIGYVISLGTGVLPTVPIRGGVNISSSSIEDIFHDISAGKKLLNLFVSQCTETFGQDVDRSRAWCESIGVPFFRFSPPIDNVPLDETNNQILIKMLYDTMLYTLKHRAEYDQLAHLLLTKK